MSWQAPEHRWHPQTLSDVDKSWSPLMRQSTSLPPSDNSIPIQTTTTLPVLKQNTVETLFAPIQQQCNSLTTTFLHEQHPQNSFVSDVDKPISSVHLRRQTDFIGSLSDQQIALEEYWRQRLGETSSRQVPNTYYRPPDSYYQNHLASSPEGRHLHFDVNLRYI